MQWPKKLLNVKEIRVTRTIEKFGKIIEYPSSLCTLAQILGLFLGLNYKMDLFCIVAFSMTTFIQYTLTNVNFFWSKDPKSLRSLNPSIIRNLPTYDPLQLNFSSPWSSLVSCPTFLASLGAFIHFHLILVSHNCQEGPGLIMCFMKEETKCILTLCICS